MTTSTRRAQLPVAAGSLALVGIGAVISGAFVALLVTAGAGQSRYRPDLTDFCLVARASLDAPLRMIEIAPYSCRKLGRYGRLADDDD